MHDSTETLDEEWAVVRPGVIRLAGTKYLIEQGPNDKSALVTWAGLRWFEVAADLDAAKEEVRKHRARLIAFGYVP